MFSLLHSFYKEEFTAKKAPLSREKQKQPQPPKSILVQ